jgi:hypothetical protein
MKQIMYLVLMLSSVIAVAANPDSGAPVPLVESDQRAVPDRLPTGTVRRANFTSGVQDHEPVDNLLSLSNTETLVYFFTELRGFDGQVVTHRWTYNDEVLAEVKFNVGGQRWRVWSKKTLLPFWIGDIHVSVVDENGHVLDSKMLEYIEASQ